MDTNKIYRIGFFILFFLTLLLFSGELVGLRLFKYNYEALLLNLIITSSVMLFFKSRNQRNPKFWQVVLSGLTSFCTVFLAIYNGNIFSKDHLLQNLSISLTSILLISYFLGVLYAYIILKKKTRKEL
ncbi:hypothetical protein ACWOB3_10970 [Enterococcus songbeiensis]